MPEELDLPAGDSSPLILGFVVAMLHSRLPELQEGIRIEGVEPIYDDEGTMKALRVHMGSGAYRVDVTKEGPPDVATD